jgi:hypothetical protein
MRTTNFLITLLFVSSSVLAVDAPAPSRDILVGINYFAGWWEPLPNKWHDKDGDWREKLPERRPLLGGYNTQATMNAEIDVAADHGVDFFAILWYYNSDGKPREANSLFLERGLNTFMAAPNAERMKFMVEFCNHPPYEVENDADWEACIQTWMPAFAHPSYLRVAGKLVFKVHGGHYFLQQNGKDKARCRRQLERLRSAVRDAGLGEMLIGCGVGNQEAIPAGHWAAELFDYTATYMEVPPLPQQSKDYPYATLMDHTEKGWKKHAQDAVPYMPHMPAGWCPRPWPDKRAYFALPTRDEWRDGLQRLKTQIKKNACFGLGDEKAFTIYAWNEFGEGGFVAPTQGDQYMKLDEIKKVFE